MNRIITAGYMVLLSCVAFAAESGWQGPPVVGTLQTYSRSQPDTKMAGKFYVNRVGFRSEMQMGPSKIINIANSKEGKCWYADEGKNILMETSFNLKTGICPSFMGEAMDAGADKSSAEAVPCEGYTVKISLGGDIVAGREVEKWACSGGSRNDSETQWHDQKLKFILKSETSNGDCMEFVEVKETSFAASLLEKPRGMKFVSAVEFRKAIFGGMFPPGMPTR
jgi:hypothetical protein